MSFVRYGSGIASLRNGIRLAGTVTGTRRKGRRDKRSKTEIGGLPAIPFHFTRALHRARLLCKPGISVLESGVSSR